MKRIMLLTVCLVAAVVIGFSLRPDETRQYVDLAAQSARKVWGNVEGNPLPVFLALGTFLVTVLYHKTRGKSLRESVEVAATKVTVVTVPVTEAGEHENPVVKRARARATRAQLLTDQMGIQTRQRKLPEEITRAEKESCYTQQALTEAERSLRTKQKAHDESVAKLKALRKEKAESDAELTAIEMELKRLADVV